MAMRKGEQTKALIVQKASKLFNRQGYMASSISDIMHETGLGKGGIYNHFESKEELMLSAFSFSVEVMSDFFTKALAQKEQCMDRLLAVASVFEALAERDIMPGGCPVMNAAVEADDANPLLREKARSAMDRLLGLVRGIVAQGIQKGEAREDADPEYVATVVVSTLEGALMLSKLYKNTEYMKRAIDHLKEFLAQQLHQTA